MNYTNTHDQGAEYKLNISFDSKDFSDTVNRKIAEAGKRMSHKGFRRGQMPTQAIKSVLGEALYYEAASELVQQHYPEIIEKEKIELAGQPELTSITIADDKQSADCVLAYSIFPEIKLPKIEDMTIEIMQVKKSEEDCDNVIKMMRERNPEWESSDKPVATKDRVLVDFEGTLDEEPFQGGSAKQQQIVIGSGGFLPDFEEGIIGMKTGEEKTILVTFPKDYQSKELAEKTAKFHIKVTQAEKPKLAEMNEKFFTSQGSKANTAASFKQDIETNIARHAASIMQENKRNACMEALQKLVELDLPNQLVQQEAMQMQNETMEWLTKQNADIKKEKLVDLFPLEQFKERAEQRVANWIIFRALNKTIDIKVSDTDIEEFLKEENSSQPEDIRESLIVQLKDNPQERQKIEAAIKERKIFDSVCAQAKVSYKDKPYMEYFKETNK